MNKVKLLIETLCAAGIAATLTATIQPETAHEHKQTGIGIWSGYTTAAMNDVNNNIRDAAAGGSVENITGGYTLAVDYLYEVLPRLSVGPRVEYVSLNQGKASSAAFLTYKQNLYLVPLMAGGRYALVENGKWYLSAGLFLGVGFGYGDTKTRLLVAPGVETETKYDGAAFTGEALIGSRYALGENTYLGLDIGYRMARIDRMSISATSTSTEMNGGGNGGGGLYAPISKAVVQDLSGNELAYDFSGLIANVGLNLKF